MDAYTLLGLAPGASLDDVRMAYHRLATLYHPDHRPATERQLAERQMTAINEARAQVQRDIYDRAKPEWPSLTIPRQRSAADAEASRRAVASYSENERLVRFQQAAAAFDAQHVPEESRWRDAVVPMALAAVVAVGFFAHLPIPVLLALLGILLIASAISLAD